MRCLSWDPSFPGDLGPDLQASHTAHPPHLASGPAWARTHLGLGFSSGHHSGHGEREEKRGEWGGPLLPTDRLGPGFPASRPPASPSAEPAARAPVLPATREGACGVPDRELRVRGPECGPGEGMQGEGGIASQRHGVLRDQQGRRKGGGLMGGGRHGDPVGRQDAAPFQAPGLSKPAGRRSPLTAPHARPGPWSPWRDGQA